MVLLVDNQMEHGRFNDIMRFSKKDLRYIELKKKLRIRSKHIEDIIIQCLETGNFKLCEDIVDVVLEFYPDEIPRNILRNIYTIMNIDLSYLPLNYKEDMVLL